MIRDEARGAFDEYTADEFDDKILSSLWDLGQSSAANSLPIRADEIIAQLDKDVHVVGLGDPSKAALSALGIPNVSFWSSIIQDAPIDIIDGPMESIERCVAMAGLIAGIMTGHMALAYACFKELVYSEVHKLSVAAVEHLMNSDHSRNSGSPSRTNCAGIDSDAATTYFVANEMAAETVGRARRTEQAATSYFVANEMAAETAVSPDLS